MARVTEMEKGIATVGGLIKSLQRFPADMPISGGLGSAMVVYHVVPVKGESFDDRRGQIEVREDDGTFD